MNSRTILAATVLALSSLAVQAQTQVQDAWVRGTVPAQKATGAFMRLTAAQASRLVSVASPVAGVAEVHEMRMEGSVMKMAALANGLELPAGKPVELKPGGYHVMLMDLKQPLSAGDLVPLTLTLQGADGKKEVLELKVPVRALNAPAAAQPMHDHKH
jgi:copper(I)-binding protein